MRNLCVFTIRKAKLGSVRRGEDVFVWRDDSPYQIYKQRQENKDPKLWNQFQTASRNQIRCSLRRGVGGVNAEKRHSNIVRREES